MKGLDALKRQVFISYAQENEKIVDTIYDTLKSKDISCWAAHRDIAGGQNWLDELSKAISNSRIMIVVISEFTEKSRYVRREVRQAVDEDLIIVPLCIEKVSLTSGLSLLLNDYQWINAYPHIQDKYLDRLVDTLQTYLGIEPEEGKSNSDNSFEYEKKRPRVFICHVSEDKDIALNLHKQLKAAGLNPWIDKDNLRGGDQWDDRIQKVIKKEIDYFLVLQTKNLKNKLIGYVNKEIYIALEHQKTFRPNYCFIIPLQTDEDGRLEELEDFQAVSIDSENKIEDLIHFIEMDEKKKKINEKVEKYIKSCKQ